jgi:hypothetical protein
VKGAFAEPCKNTTKGLAAETIIGFVLIEALYEIQKKRLTGR